MGGESQWVTFKVGQEVFGFEIQFVKEMLRLPQVHAVPLSTPDHLGVVLLRSAVIPVFDLRQRFGMTSLSQGTAELVSLLQDRLRDHEDWLAELSASNAERREFGLTTDPHDCAFGQWYDNFHTEDLGLSRLLSRFDEPHRAIHQLGETILIHQRNGEWNKAQAELDQSGQSILTSLRRLFSEAIAQIEDQGRPSLIIVASAAATLGVAVDEIHAVVRCEDSEIQAPDSIPGSEEFGGLIGLLPIKGTPKFTMLLDPAQIYPQLVLQMPGAAR
jgi:chemotaxis signal transduction protein